MGELLSIDLESSTAAVGSKATLDVSCSTFEGSCLIVDDLFVFDVATMLVASSVVTVVVVVIEGSVGEASGSWFHVVGSIR